MPEGDLRIAGFDTHVPRKYSPLVIVGGLAAAFFLLRPRPVARGSTAGLDASLAAAQSASNQQSLEFANLQQMVGLQLAQLNAASAIEMQQLNQQYQLSAGLNPGLQTQCIPYAQWYNLANDVRGNLVQQARNGQLYMTAGVNGVCFAPTQQGIQGHPPLVTNSSGLFSSSSTGYPSTVGTPPQPGIIPILQGFY